MNESPTLEAWQRAGHTLRGYYEHAARLNADPHNHDLWRGWVRLHIMLGPADAIPDTLLLAPGERVLTATGHSGIMRGSEAGGYYLIEVDPPGTIRFLRAHYSTVAPVLVLR